MQWPPYCWTSWLREDMVGLPSDFYDPTLITMMHDMSNLAHTVTSANHLHPTQTSLSNPLEFLSKCPVMKLTLPFPKSQHSNRCAIVAEN